MTNTEFVVRCKAVGLYEGSLTAWLEKVESLQAKVKELEAENTELKSSKKRMCMIELLTTEQAKVKVLTDALEAYPDQGEYFMENLEATDMKKEALSTAKKWNLVVKQSFSPLGSY